MSPSLLLRQCLFILLATLLLSGCDKADNPKKGTIDGKVTDSKTGTGIESVIANTKPAYDSTLTDAGGLYSFTGVDPGQCTVVFSKGGYLKDSTTVTVSAGNTTTVDRTLHKIYYTGTWKGETTWLGGYIPSNLPVYLHIDENNIVDSLSFRIEMHFPTFTCRAYFYSETDIEIIDGRFEGTLFNPLTNLTTTVSGNCKTDRITGLYNKFSTNSFWATCGGKYTEGIGNAGIDMGMWGADKE